ncbi:(d)CMP kinase, partial [Aquimarina celericrescens]|nr:(d)CMP kinase [Aquimarina celericrescens]
MKIAVCGYMGSGKSTVSQLLAEKLKWDFIELDKEIEKKE